MIRRPPSSPLFPSTPLFRSVEAEGRVLAKTRATLLAAAILIILTAALCVTATLTAWVLDRRRDFAIMKALGDRKSTRLNSSHSQISYAVFCLKKKKELQCNE